MDKVSIIVPVYNIEDCIEECVRSILRQDWNNLQILLIDDGSEDKSGAICDRYAREDSRIQVVHRENGGLSAALNTGLDHATGEWILFVDGDDIIHSGLVTFCMNLCCDNDTDIVQYAFRSFKDQEMFEKKWESSGADCVPPRVLTGEAGLGYICLKNNPVDYPNLRLTTTIRWSKLYRKDLFNELRYPEGKIHEDEWLIHRIFTRAKRIVFSPFVGYFYRIREKSIMQVGISAKSMDKAEAFLDRVFFFKENHYDEYKKYMVNKCVAYCIQVFCKGEHNDKQEQKIIKEKVSEILMYLKGERKDFSAKTWAFYLGYMYCPTLLRKVFRWHHK